MIDGDSLRLSQATAVIQALNAALDAPVPGKARVRAMLAELRRLLDRDADVELLLFDEMARQPCPRLVDRVWTGPVLQRIEPRSPEQMQRAVDLAAPMWRDFYPLLQQHGTAAAVWSEDWPDFLETVWGPKHLQPNGWVDMATGAWMANEDTMVQLHVFRTANQPPFSEEDRNLMLLMARAMAPLIKRELFDDRQFGLEGLSARRQEVLRLLLHGLSEKEMARELHRSVETVHNHVRAVYRHFGVSSRGELMAQFIDRTRFG